MPIPAPRSIIPNHPGHLELPAGESLDQLVATISELEMPAAAELAVTTARLEIPAAIVEGSEGTSAQEPLESEIALEAYSLFEARGCEHGHDVEDWLAAEALVRQRAIRPTTVG